jgi:hypothetical protein
LEGVLELRQRFVNGNNVAPQMYFVRDGHGSV